MSSIWAIADLHLCFGAPDKSMELFGPAWQQYTTRLKANWEECVHENDLVLIAGDISWAMKLEDAQKDLDWIEKLPGTKVIIKGNHDYWWSSLSKVRAALPPSMHAIQNDAFSWNDVSVGGTRLWDSNEYSFSSYIDFQGEAPISKEEADEKIFLRELGRLELSLQKLDQGAKLRIVMTHYPPISAALADSRVSKLLEQYHVDHCLFGHLHQLKPNQKLFGIHKGIHYHLTSADYLEFTPLLISEGS